MKTEAEKFDKSKKLITEPPSAKIRITVDLPSPENESVKKQNSSQSEHSQSYMEQRLDEDTSAPGNLLGLESNVQSFYMQHPSAAYDLSSMADTKALGFHQTLETSEVPDIETFKEHSSVELINEINENDCNDNDRNAPKTDEKKRKKLRRIKLKKVTAVDQLRD